MYNSCLDGYTKTKFRKSQPKEGNYGVFGVDCEMCYTNVGLEVTKVSNFHSQVKDSTTKIEL